VELTQAEVVTSGKLILLNFPYVVKAILKTSTKMSEDRTMKDITFILFSLSYQ
jgi:hypothetical protein